MVNSRANPSGWSVGDELTSGQQNNVDIGQARSIDKTNETAASGGGVSGEIDFLSGSSIVLKSGSTLSSVAGATVSLAGTTNIALLSGTTATSGTVNLGGTINISGSTTVSNSFSISGATETINTNSTLLTNGIIAYTVTTIGSSGTTYTCDSGSNKDYYVLVNTSANFKTITLPTPTVGRTIYFKDISDNAGSKDITITHHAGETIDGSANVTMNVGFGVLAVISDGVNWSVIHNSGTI